MKAITGPIHVDSGAVSVAGKDVTGLPGHLIARSGLGYVPQVGNVFPSLTVGENLEMGGFPRKSGLKERIAQALDICPDLKLARDKRPRALRGGQRNLLGNGRGLV